MRLARGGARGSGVARGLRPGRRRAPALRDRVEAHGDGSAFTGGNGLRSTGSRERPRPPRPWRAARGRWRVAQGRRVVVVHPDDGPARRAAALGEGTRFTSAQPAGQVAGPAVSTVAGA